MLALLQERNVDSRRACAPFSLSSDRYSSCYLRACSADRRLNSVVSMEYRVMAVSHTISKFLNWPSLSPHTPVARPHAYIAPA